MFLFEHSKLHSPSGTLLLEFPQRMRFIAHAPLLLPPPPGTHSKMLLPAWPSHILGSYSLSPFPLHFFHAPRRGSKVSEYRSAQWRPVFSPKSDFTSRRCHGFLWSNQILASRLTFGAGRKKAKNAVPLSHLPPPLFHFLPLVFVFFSFHEQLHTLCVAM